MEIELEIPPRKIKAIESIQPQIKEMERRLGEKNSQNSPKTKEENNGNKNKKKI